MQIREGAYYRTRGDGKNLGQVVGPMYPVAYGVYAWGCASFFFTERGLYDVDSESEYDLISEVYVSDTPPADAPAPETKTLRDEFAGYALIGLTAAGGDLADCGRDEIAKEAWRQADAMMEARKK